MKFQTLLFILGFFSTSLIAQQPSPFSVVRGIISDSADGEPMIFTKVVLYQNDTIKYGCVSDIDGFFIMYKVLTGNYVLEASSIGYISHIDSAITVLPNKIVSRRIYMKEESKKLPTILIEKPIHDSSTR